MPFRSLHPEKQLAGWRDNRNSGEETIQMAARAKQPGQVTVYSVETGDAFHRWPVDARGMVDCGEYSHDPPDGAAPVEEDGGNPSEFNDLGEDDAGDTILKRYAEGYYVAEKGGGWYALKDSGGQQVGKAQRSPEDAQDLLPATHRPGGQASANTVEHSPGVPLQADDGS